MKLLKSKKKGNRMRKYNLKKSLLIILVFVLLVSCNKNNNQKNKNTTDNNTNRELIEVANNNMIKISVDEFINKFNNEKDFSFVITKSSCNMCKDLYELLNKHKNIKIDYEIRLDNADKNYKEDLKKLKNILPNLMVAPDLNFKKGNKVYRFDSEYSDINYENLSSWLKKYK